VTTTINPTTWLSHPDLSAAAGCDLILASETAQHTGSFKFRAAYHVAANVPHDRLITASSGNFGQALAYAARLLGKACHVVMPTTSAQVKIAAVASHGAEVDLIDTRTVSRADRVRALAARHPDAYVASPYDDDLVIAGNASLGHEIAERTDLTAVIAPIGGGGLASGIVSGLRDLGRTLPVWGAEPLLANDAARSLRAGTLIANGQEPQTIADGARTISLGRRNWAILQPGLADIVEVPEAAIRAAVALLYTALGLVVEPTGALSLAALLTEPERLQGQRVCAVVSGANVDPDVHAALLTATPL
jgi:threonine dehydratase